MAIGIISNLYMHENGIHGKADIRSNAPTDCMTIRKKGEKHDNTDNNNGKVKKGKGSDKKWKKK